MDGGAWWATVHGVPKSWARLGACMLTLAVSHWYTLFIPAPLPAAMLIQLILETALLPIFQVRKLSPETRTVALDHKAGKWQSQDFDPGCLT